MTTIPDHGKCLKPADLKRLVNPHSQELRFVIAAPNAF